MRDHFYRQMDAGRWQLSLAALDGMAAPGMASRHAPVERGLLLSRLGHSTAAVHDYLRGLGQDPESRAVLEAALSLAIENRQLSIARSLVAHILSGPFADASPIVLYALRQIPPPFGCVQIRDGVASGWAVGRVKTLQVESLGRRSEINASQATPQLLAAGIGDGANGFAIIVPDASPVLRFGIDGVSLWGSPVRTAGSSSGSNGSNDGIVPVPPPPEALPAPARAHVLIPVFGDAPSLRRCLDAVAHSPELHASQVWVIEDCPTDPDVRKTVRETCQRRGFQLLSRTFNAGFSAAVNSAMRVIPAGDVVLLNSDTMVCDNWLARLQAAAYSANDIATVTPLSNNGEALSHPTPRRASPFRETDTIAILDRLCRKQRARPIEIPTGVGFCLFIRADARQAAGEIDEATFGRGYGEETDYCLRLSRAGWRHVVAPNVFVGHEGGASFGAERSLLAARNTHTLYARYPTHSDEYDNWLANDPLATLRADLQTASMPQLLQSIRLDEIIVGERPEVIGWLKQISASATHEEQPIADALDLPAAYLSISADRAELDFINVPLLDKLAYPYPSAKKQLFSALGDAGVRTLVIRSLSPTTLKFIEGCSTGLDLVFSLDDASGFCPRGGATVEEGRRCNSAQTATQCDACVARLSPQPGRPADTASWRRRVDKQLARATRILVGDAPLGRSYLQHFPRRSIDVSDVSGTALSAAGLLQRFGPDARFAVIGANSVASGFVNLCDAMLESFRLAPAMHFLLLNQSFGLDALASFENLSLLRNARQPQAAELLRQHGCCALLIASLEPGAEQSWEPVAQALSLPLISLTSGALS